METPQKERNIQTKAFGAFTGAIAAIGIFVHQLSKKTLSHVILKHEKEGIFKSLQAELMAKFRAASLKDIMEALRHDFFPSSDSGSGFALPKFLQKINEEYIHKAKQIITGEKGLNSFRKQWNSLDSSQKTRAVGGAAFDSLFMALFVGAFSSLIFSYFTRKKAGKTTVLPPKPGEGGEVLAAESNFGIPKATGDVWAQRLATEEKALSPAPIR